MEDNEIIEAEETTEEETAEPMEVIEEAQPEAAPEIEAAAAVTAEDIQAVGAMTALLKDAIKPNLVQTLEPPVAPVEAEPSGEWEYKPLSDLDYRI